MVKWLI